MISLAMVMTWTVLLVQAQGASGAGDFPCSYLHEHFSHSMSLLSDGPPSPCLNAVMQDLLGRLAPLL